MAGYGIQNAVGSAIDNTVKVKKLVDLLPSEEDKALEMANRKAEATSLKADLKREAADKAQAMADESGKAVDELVKKGAAHDPSGDLLDKYDQYAADFASAQKKALTAEKAAQRAQAAKTSAIKAKIKVLETAGTRKKSIFDRLRGGSK